MLTVVIFSANGALIFAGIKAGVLRMYFDIPEHGWAYAGLSLLVLVLAHDTWFYWTHRLMHRRGLFRWTHLAHHRSVAPTPWAAYSFAPAEALVQAVFLPLILLVLPLLAAVTGKSVVQTRALIAARFPRPDVPSTVRRLPERRTMVQPSLTLSASEEPPAKRIESRNGSMEPRTGRTDPLVRPDEGVAGARPTLGTPRSGLGTADRRLPRVL